MYHTGTVHRTDTNTDTLVAFPPAAVKAEDGLASTLVRSRKAPKTLRINARGLEQSTLAH